MDAPPLLLLTFTLPLLYLNLMSYLSMRPSKRVSGKKPQNRYVRPLEQYVYRYKAEMLLLSVRAI